MVPTLQATLGVKGHRPKVGTRDCKDLLYVFAVVNLVNAALHANTLESPKDATKKYTTTWFDMFRIEGGRIAEHWDAAPRQ